MSEFVYECLGTEVRTTERVPESEEDRETPYSNYYSVIVIASDWNSEVGLIPEGGCLDKERRVR